MAEITDPGSPSARARPQLVRAAIAVVLAVALLVGAIAYGVGSALPSVYQSSGVIRVTVLSQQGISDPTVIAANDLATQIAQLATSQPVLSMAARRLGVGAGSLTDKINGSTIGAQNLVQVTATADSREGAAARAAAATASLADYEQSLNGSGVNRYLTTVQAALAPLQQSIDASYARIAKDSAVRRAADTLQLETLLATRSQVIGEVSRDVASSRPDLQIVSASSAPSVVYPRPALYALVAFLAALIIAGRVAFMVVSRRTRQ